MPGESFDPMRFPKAIQDAGFTPREVMVSVDGILVRKEGDLELEVSGLLSPFILVGRQVEKLRTRAELVGQKIRVKGKLADQRAHLTVETFETLP